jgi:GntR family transcriptional regulator
MAPPGARAKVSSDDPGVTRRAAVAREPATAPRAGVDPASPTPLYHQIFSLLRGKIYDGQYPGGSFLPSEQELSAEFNVSRITAKRALDELAADGLVVREQGRGTRVCINTHSTSVRGSVKGLVHSLHANGRGSVQLLDFGYLPASEAIAAQLGLNVGDEV